MDSLLLDEWFESDLRQIFERAIELLTTDARALRGANDIVQQLQHFLDSQRQQETSGGTLEHTTTGKSMRLYALQVLGTYHATQSKETRRMIAQQLVHALELIPKASNKPEESIDVEDQVVADFVVELNALSTRDALEKLRKEDALVTHICLVRPADGEKCQRVPTRIAIHLDPLVTSVNKQQVLKVTHGRGASVHGHVTYSSSDGVLTFTPTVAFEKKCRYLVKVRCAEIRTCLGGPALAGGDASFHFSTT